MSGIETVKAVEDRIAIHPAAKQLFAESPYTRKLKRLLEDVAVVEGFAPEDDKATLTAIWTMLSELALGKGA